MLLKLVSFILVFVMALFFLEDVMIPHCVESQMHSSFFEKQLQCQWDSESCSEPGSQHENIPHKDAHFGHIHFMLTSLFMIPYKTIDRWQGEPPLYRFTLKTTAPSLPKVPPRKSV